MTGIRSNNPLCKQISVERKTHARFIGYGTILLPMTDDQTAEGGVELVNRGPVRTLLKAPARRRGSNRYRRR